MPSLRRKSPVLTIGRFGFQDQRHRPLGYPSVEQNPRTTRTPHKYHDSFDATSATPASKNSHGTLSHRSTARRRKARVRAGRRYLSKSGSHWVTHADWGCRDGDHRAWIIIEAEDKDEARRIVPPAFRASAKVTGLNKFTVADIDTILREHRP
jgi:hypothetical protein